MAHNSFDEVKIPLENGDTLSVLHENGKFNCFWICSKYPEKYSGFIYKDQIEIVVKNIMRIE